MAKKVKITFTNKGFVICDSAERRENGVFWKTSFVKGKNAKGENVISTIEGFSTNDLIKTVEEIENAS